MNRTDFIKFLSGFELSYAKLSKILELMGNDFSFEKFISSDEIEKLLKDEHGVICKKANDEYFALYTDKLASLGISILTRGEKDYPDKLERADEPPHYLFYKGDISLLAKKCIAVVGTRSPSGYGITVTERFAGELASSGGVIVSGLAYGVDSIAHRKTLDVGGKTIAVLGGGFNQIYPSEHTNLFNEIAEKGLVLSEHRPDVRALKYTFVQRNRIVAAISDALLITEAGGKSGTSITKDFALDYGVPVYAVPGNITSPKSEGTNSLIACMQGICALNCSGIMSELGLDARKQKTRQLSIEESEIVSALESGDKDVNELSEKLQINVNNLSSLLTILEIKGIIKRLPGGFYSRG